MPTDHHLNFRLRGIPLEYQSRADVRELVKSILSLRSSASIAVYSLAIDPIKHNSKIATLSFHALPTCLSDRSKNEWSFNLPPGETSDKDSLDWRKSLVLDTHFSGFTPFQHAEENDCHLDVIAMSGLGGHAFGSFKEKNGPFMWLRDALPLDFPSARILVYGYDTGLIRSSSFQNLTDLGSALQIDMKGIREFYRSRPIVFIGHSLGGLVIKEAIVKLKEEMDEKDVSILNYTSGFLFFGVPHQGMAIESLVPLVRDQPNRGLLESLNKNSGLLQRLEKEFSNAFSTKFPQIVSFYETERSPTAVQIEDGKWEMSGPLEILVDISSATCGSKHQYPLGRNHSEMVKYNNQHDQFYSRVTVALRGLVDRAKATSVVVSTGIVNSCMAEEFATRNTAPTTVIPRKTEEFGTFPLQTSSDETVRFQPASNTTSSSSDGQLLASGSHYKTVRLWDPATVALKRRLKGHESSVRAVAFSPDGQLLASGSGDKTVGIWNPATGALKWTLKGHEHWVSAVAFSPDGQLLASGSHDKTVGLWDPATGALKWTLKRHSDWVSAVAFSPDGQLLASVSHDKTVRLWDPATGALKRTLKVHESWVNSVAFSPDGQLLASVSADKTVGLWDPATGALKRRLKGHESSVRAVAFSPDGQLLAFGSGDKTVKLWDPATGALKRTLKGHESSVNSVAFSPDGQLLASGSADKTVGLWDLTT